MNCPVCRRPGKDAYLSLCAACRQSYNRRCEGRSILEIIEWAAARARKADRARARARSAELHAARQEAYRVRDVALAQGDITAEAISPPPK